MDKRTIPIAIIAFVVLLLSAVLVGRATKHCECADRQPAIDSLTFLARDAAREALEQRAIGDSLRARYEHDVTTREPVKTQVGNAYRALHVPVDSLAGILLASPDTIR